MNKALLCLVVMSSLLFSNQALAKTTGNTNMKDECVVYIQGDWVHKTGKVNVTISSANGINKGKATVYIYDEFNALRAKQVINKTGTVNLNLKGHKFYTLKFQNAYNGAQPLYYNSTRYKVTVPMFGNAKIE